MAKFRASLLEIEEPFARLAQFLRSEEQRERKFQEFLRPTDPHWILLSSLSTSRQRRKAARAIAAKMPTQIADRKAYYALKEERAQQWLREEIFVPALLEAARSRNRPQYIRIGRKWVTDERGRKSRVRPMEGSVPFAKRWLMTRAWAIAAKKLIAGRPLAPLTDKQRETILLLAKKQGVTPDALRKRAARAAAT